MSINLDAWNSVIKQVVSSIADEDYQRRAWFGAGPEASSPDEVFCQFFGDAAIEEFVKRDDNGWNTVQLNAAKHLINLMNELSDQTQQHIKPSDLVDDPRWAEIRKAAAKLSSLLSGE